MVPFYKIIGKNIVEADKPQVTIWRVAGYLRLQTHTQNMIYLLLLHCDNGCTNAPQRYVTHELPVLLGARSELGGTR